MFTDLRFPLLIFKAITKKQVWVAGYTKKDGTPVAAHHATVNVQLDHDHKKVASGNGSGPQKEAWKHLSKQEGHRKLSVEEQAHNIAHLATEIQADKTNAAQVTFFKQSILDGKKPRPADIRAFQNAPRDRKLSAAYAIIDAGKEMDLDNLIGDIKPGDWSVTDGAVFEKQETGEWKEIERRVKSKKPPKPKTPKHFDPDHDDLLAAIAKLGGLSREDAKAQGIDPAEFNRRGYSFKRVFTHGGMSFDDMAHNLLGPEGYPAGDANELLDSLSTALGGQKVYTPNGHMNAMDAAYSEDYEPIPDDYLGDYDGSRYAMGEYAEAWTPVSDAAFEMATDHAQGESNETNRETAEAGGVVQSGGGEGQPGGDSDASATAGGDGQGQGQQGGGEGAGVEEKGRKQSQHGKLLSQWIASGKKSDELTLDDEGNEVTVTTDASQEIEGIPKKEFSGDFAKYGIGKHDYEIQDVPIDQLQTPHQEDDWVDEANVKSLADHIKSGKMDGIGAAMPVLLGDDNSVIDGHHRLAAAKMLGEKTIPALVPVKKGTGKVLNIDAYGGGKSDLTKAVLIFNPDLLKAMRKSETLLRW